MIQENTRIRMPDGVSDCVLIRPDGNGRAPGVIHLTDIGGIRPAHIEMARQLAAEGYSVLMPNLFYRTASPPVFEFAPGAEREQRMKRMAELTAPLTPECIESDAAGYLDFFLGQNCVLSDRPLGVAGHCYSGAVALRFAAALPDRIAACASFHGGRLVTDAPTSPHLLLPKIKARLYFGHAIQDTTMPEEAIRILEAALAAWGGQYESEVYEGAYHGWTAPDSPAYNPHQARRAFARLTELFESTIRQA